MNTFEQYKNFTLDELENEFLDAAYNGELEKMKYLLTSPELKQLVDIETCDFNGENALHFAARGGHLEVIKYLLTSNELSTHLDVDMESTFSGTAFIIACEKGHLDIVKYVLNSEELEDHADINIHDSMALTLACDRENLELLKYLISDPELNENISLQIRGQETLEISLSLQNYEIAKFLLESNIIHYVPDAYEIIFKNAYTKNEPEMMEYLIFKLDIDKILGIDEFIANSNNQSHIITQIDNMFKLRDLNQQLNKELSSNNISAKKSKI